MSTDQGQRTADVFVQWKNTDVCLDFWCECGEGGHSDGWGCYVIQCGACGRRYEPVVTLRAVDPDAPAVPATRIVGGPDDEG